MHLSEQNKGTFAKPRFHEADAPTMDVATAPRSSSAEYLPPGSAEERLAMILFGKMEHLDPTDDYDWNAGLEENWRCLSDQKKAFFLLCIDRLSVEVELWANAFRSKEILRQRPCIQELRAVDEKTT